MNISRLNHKTCTVARKTDAPTHTAQVICVEADSAGNTALHFAAAGGPSTSFQVKRTGDLTISHMIYRVYVGI